MSGRGEVCMRAPGCPFRVLPSGVLVARPEGDSVTLGGSAALVWLVLDEPASRAEIVERAEVDWPDLGPADVANLDDALARLTAEGLLVPQPRSDST